MRQLLVLGAAIVAILSLVTVAQGDGYEGGHVWFFGNCENPYDSPDFSDTDSGGGYFLGHGCRGIGIFAGQWDNESIAEYVSYEAGEEFGGSWEVDHLKAINIFGGPPVTGVEYGCGPQTPISLTPQTYGGGLWIAIFSVEPCEPEPAGPLLAVAYVDSNISDGGYHPELDTLVAKLVDVDLSGTVNVGDAVVMRRYPKDFAAAALGDFATRIHYVTAVTESISTRVTVLAGADGFSWEHIASGEQYAEGSGLDTTWFRDSFNTLFSFPDLIQVASGSPSAADDAIAQILGFDSSDQAFLDVEIFVIDVCPVETAAVC